MSKIFFLLINPTIILFKIYPLVYSMFKKHIFYLMVPILFITGCKGPKDFDFRDISDAPFYFETEGEFNVYSNLDFNDEDSYSNFIYRFSSDEGEDRSSVERGSYVMLFHSPHFNSGISSRLRFYLGNVYLTEGHYSFDNVKDDIDSYKSHLISISNKKLKIKEGKIVADLGYGNRNTSYYLVSESGEMNIRRKDDETLVAEFTIEFARVILNSDIEIEVFKKSIVLKGRFLI